jgi:hypothetical protein
LSLVNFACHNFGEKITGFKIPGIYFTEDAMRDQGAIVALAKEEVSWFGVVDIDADGDFIIGELFVPEQDVSGASADVEEEGMVKMAEEILQHENGVDKFNKLRFFCHSHVNMGTTPSATDEKQAEDFSKQCDDFLIRGICNKSGRMELTLYIFKHGLKVVDAKWGVLRDEKTDETVMYWKEKLETRLKTWRTRSSAYAAAGYMGGMEGGWWDDEEEALWQEEWQRRAQAFKSLPENGAKRIFAETKNEPLSRISYKPNGTKEIVLKTGEHVLFNSQGVEIACWFEGKDCVTTNDTSSEAAPAKDEKPTAAEQAMLEMFEQLYLDPDEIASEVQSDLELLDYLADKHGLERTVMTKILDNIWRYYDDAAHLIRGKLMPRDGVLTWSQRQELLARKYTDEEINRMVAARKQAIELGFISRNDLWARQPDTPKVSV